MENVSDMNRCFASVLRGFRKSAGMSQEKLALEANLDRTYISLLERGINQPSLKTLFAIADVLHVLPHEIVREVESNLSKLSTPKV